MERAERETLDFMNVESFSQLPFIRPALPPREKGGGGASAIRLFGKEFGGGGGATNDDDNHGEGEAAVAESSKELSSENKSETSSRKFECHYCCRNFPTSQALGGHQNAHKRERQNAKRAHLLPMIGSRGGHDLMSYSRFGSAPAAAALPPPFHGSWNGRGGGGGAYSYYNAAATRSYNVHHHHPQPINGSPLGLWRIPGAAHLTPSSPFPQESHRQIPLLNPKNEQLKPFSTSQGRFAFESKPASMQDHVSLDLRL